MHKSQIVISISPNPSEIMTNSRIRLYVSKNTPQGITQINFVVEWKRVGKAGEQSISNHENSCYECSPLDMGQFIEAKIKYQDEGMLQQQYRKFGPIKLQNQLSAYFLKAFVSELIKVKVAFENIIIDMGIKVSEEGLMFISKQNFQFNIKTDTFPDLQLKIDLRIITFKLKFYSETMSKYISAILKKQLKYPLQALDIIFQSRSQRDLFIVLLKNITKRKSSSSNSFMSNLSVKEDPIFYPRGRQMNANNNIVERSRKNSENTSLSLTKKKAEKTDKTINKQKHSVKTPTPIPKTQPVSIQQEEVDILKDLQYKDLFSQFNQKKQATLNLRDSFNQLQQKYLKAKIELQQEIPIEQNIIDVKLQLTEARNEIKRLNEEVVSIKQQLGLIKQQNNGYRQTLKQFAILKQKLQYLTNQNQRLEAERTKIIADKITIEMRYQKEKEQKQILKQKLDQSMTVIQMPQQQQHRTQVNRKIYFKSPTHIKSPTNNNINQSQDIKFNQSKNTVQIQTNKEAPSEEKKNNSNFRRLDSYGNMPPKP